MSVPTYNVISTHPRLLFRASEKTALTARTDSTSAWKTEWDAKVTTYVEGAKGDPDSLIFKTSGSTTNCWEKTTAVAFWGYIEEGVRATNNAIDTAIQAAIVAVDHAPWGEQSPTRELIKMAACAYDICYNWMTQAERDKVAGWIVEIATWFVGNYSITDQMDGWTGINATSTLMGLLATHGNSAHAAKIQTLLNTTVEWIYGADSTSGRMSYPRLCYTDGHTEKGHSYIWSSLHTELFAAWCMQKATDWDSFTAESGWTTKIWEELLWHYKGGTLPAFQGMGDESRDAAPFTLLCRHAYDHLLEMNKTTEAGRMLRWMYEIWDAPHTSLWGPTRVFDVIFHDKANITPLHPKDATTPPSTSRLFSKPGVWYGRKAKRGSSDPDWDMDEIATIRISARSKYYSGHAHLDAGSMFMSVKGDVVSLTPSGIYESGATCWYQGNCRTWMQSWCPLIYKSGETWKWQNDGTSYINDGGQQWRLYRNYQSPPSKIYDPGNAWHMLNDAGGEGWERCREFSKVAEDTGYTFLFANIRDAYKLDFDSTPKCSILEMRYLVIWPTSANGLYWPAVLYYARIKKADASYPTKIPIHSATTWTSTSYGATTEGYQHEGKLWLDVFNKSAYTLTIRAPSDSTAFTAPWNTVNYPPTGWNAQEEPFKTNSMLTIAKTTSVQEEHYVILAMLSEAGDSEPAASRSWITDADWYGVTLNGVDHRIHKTLKQVSVGGGGPDVTPPAEVSGLSAQGRVRGIYASWTDPADADLQDIIVKYRTSAIV